VQGVYASRVRDLEQQLALTKNKFATLNRRRKLEIQGAAASAAAHKREIEALKRTAGRARSRSGSASDQSAPVVLDFNDENTTPRSEGGLGEKGAAEVEFLKRRVVDMEEQLKALLTNA
jgi:hypothetical protein